MKKINEAKLAKVNGGYAGEKECPVCHAMAMTFAPNILDPEGVVYEGYVCTACHTTQYVRK